MRRLKRSILSMWYMSSHVRAWIALSKFCAERIPLIGRVLSMLLDRLLIVVYGVDVTSENVFVQDLRIPHPNGVLLGGNGIRSSGTVVVNAGVKFVGRSPKDPAYLECHASKRVFELGHNVVIGTNSVLVGPLTICDDVVIGAMSLVNKSIDEPGVYVGCPVRRVSDAVSDEWL